MHVIDSALIALITELNNYFLAGAPGSEKVVAANLLNQNGTLTTGVNGKVVLSLVNIEEDRISRSLNTYRQQPNGQVEKLNPEVKLNLYLLFIACPNSDGPGTNFTDSVENLSRVIGFFQTKNFFDHQNTPLLDQRIEKIVMDTYSLTFEQQNHLWGALGAKYMPSAMYKARLVKIQEEEVVSDGPPILTIQADTQDKNL